MTVELVNGSIYRIAGIRGSDGTCGHLRGINPQGIVADEYAEWIDGAYAEIFAPIFGQNKGWNVKIFTPKGKNQAYKNHEGLRQIMESQKAEIASGERKYLTAMSRTYDITDTYYSVIENGKIKSEPVVTEKYVADLIKTGQIDHATAQQEFYCSFNSASNASWYKYQMEFLTEKGKIGVYPYDPSYPVYTSWDLGQAKDAGGKGNFTAIWIFQLPASRRPRLIGYIQDKDKALADYFPLVYQKGFPIRCHFFPHDGNKVESNGLSKIQNIIEAGNIREPIEHVPRDGSVTDGIDRVMTLLPQCEFDEAATETGIDCLRNYSKQRNTDGSFSNKPVHGKYSDGADAFRVMVSAIHHNLVPVGRQALHSIETDLPDAEILDDNYSLY